MWFKPKAEAVQSDFKTEDVWAALQSHKSLAQQHRYVLELESRLNALKMAMTKTLVGFSVILAILTLAVAWNTYQIQQWQHQFEAVPHQDR